MPTDKRLSLREILALQKIYRRAETDIINELARLRARGLVDYHAVTALLRVQKILLSMQARAGKVIPRMVERYFYANHPERYTRYPKTAEEHRAAYRKAALLSADEIDAADRLENDLVWKLRRASDTVQENLTRILLGRQAQDIFREKGLEMVVRQQATGMKLNVQKDFVEELQRKGITAFTDKAGKQWSLRAYADMATRTISRQAEVLSVLTKFGDHDLFMISKNGSTCPICAPLEGRVYSKSGTDPDFPPLATAFGKIDPNGPNTLRNTYLNIHPNCLHVLIPWTPAGKTPEQIEKIKRFSNPKTNPLDQDPRSKRQVEEYKRKEEGRAKITADIDQWKKYRIAGIGPASFETFLKHKLAGDEKYEEWAEQYRQLGRP